MKTGRALRLADWLVHPDRGEAERGGETVRVEPMSMKLLLLLAEHPGRTVGRDEIVERLWDGRVVTDDAITKQISRLRAVFADDPKNPTLVRTVPKVGVRLLAEPLWVSPAAPGSTPGRRLRLLWAVALLPILALAVWLLWSGPHEETFRLTQRPLTSSVGLEFDPAVSPDGRFLAYAARGPGEAASAIFVTPLDGEAPRRLSAPGMDAFGPAWSESGRLAFAERKASSCAIHVAAITGGARKVADCVAILGLAWRGEQALVAALHEREGAAFRLVLIDLRTGARRFLTAPPPGAIGDRLPLVSSDGATAWFARTRTVGVEHVLELDIESGRTRALSSEAAHIIGLAPGGPGALLVASNRGAGAMGLWRLDVARGNWRQVAPAVDAPPSATGDGRTIVVARSENRTSLWRQPLAGGEAVAVTDTTRSDWLPILSRGGDLAFLSDRSGARELWLRSGEGAPRRLSDFGGPAIQDPAWSPDGRRIAVAVPRERDFDLHIVDSESGAARQVTSGPGDDRHPAFSPDGRYLYFSRRTGSAYALMRLEFATGKALRLRATGLRPIVSDDGSALYFGRLFNAGLFRLPLAGGPVERLTDWPEWNDMRNWTLSGGALWGVKRDREGVPTLMRFDPATRAERPVFALAEVAQPSGLTVGGGGAIYARRMAAESDLVLLRLEKE